MTSNRPGEEPRLEVVEKIAKTTLGLDDNLVLVPPESYRLGIKAFLKTNPYDTNFIVELSKPLKPFYPAPSSSSSSSSPAIQATQGTGIGGNGYGLVTCMDEYCWKDIALGPDLEKEGGAEDGFGSFSEYAMHCNDPDHIRGRTSRCKENGITIHPPIQSTFLNAPAPSTSTASRTTSAPSRSSSSSNLLSALDATRPKSTFTSPNTTVKPEPTSQSSPTSTSSRSPLAPAKLLDLKPTIPKRDIKPDLSRLKPIIRTGSKEDAILVFSDSDDEVIPLAEDEIPMEYRKVTNKDNPFELSDDDDDDWFGGDGQAGGSGSSGSFAAMGEAQKSSLIEEAKRTFATDFGHASNKVLPDARPWTLSQRKTALQEEVQFCIDQRHDLRKSNPVTNAAYIRFLTDRIQILTDLLRGGGMSQYIPPNKLLSLKFPELSKWNPDKAPSPSTISTQAVTTPSARTSIFDVGTSNGYPNVGSSNPVSQAAFTAQSLKALRENGGSRFGLSEAQCKAIDEHAQRAMFPPNPFTPYAAAAYNFGGGGNLPGTYPGQGMGLGYEGGLGDFGGLGGGAVAGPGPGTRDPVMDIMNGMEFDGDTGYPYEFNRVRGAEDLKAFFSDALKDFSEDTTIEDALKTLGLSSLKDQLPGMNITLMPHQVLGVSFMVGKENDEKYLGGILGDAMGLGKTVQAIATIVKNPSQDTKVKTTLVVAPVALLSQWKTEIETKTTKPLNVLIYHGTGRTTSANVLRQYDVVITTMGCISGEYPREIKKPKKKKNKTNFVVEDDEMDELDPDDNEGGTKEKPEPVYKKRGLLYKMRWYRVIIDEAHGIRNRQTHAAKAAFELDSHLRWCLTGTLIINSLTDVFSHLHFLGIGPHSEWKHFRDTVHAVQTRQPKRASQRLQVVLRTCMLRRTKDSELDGKKLLILPPKTIDVVELDFSPEERAIYNAIEMRAKVRFNKFVKLGTVLKNYHVVLVLLMRLRQLTCHPWLIRRANGQPLSEHDLTVTDDDIFGDIDAPRVDGMSEVARAITLVGQDFVDRVKEKLKARYLHMRDADNDQKGDKGGEHDVECSICFDAFVDERVTGCGHSFCSGCMDDWFNNVAAPGTDLSDDQIQQGARSCPLCRAPIHKSRIFRAEAFFNPDELEAEGDDDDDDDVLEDVSRGKGKGKGKGKEVVKSEWDSDDEGSQAEEVDDEDAEDEDDGKMTKGFGKGKKRASEVEDVKPRKLNKGKGKAIVKGEPGEEDDTAAHFEEVEDERGIEDVLPSTKMIKMGDLIEEWEAEDKTQKILVFSQFTSFLSLIALDLDRREIPYSMYLGSHSQKAREEAVREFTMPSGGRNSPRVMLISLKAGGVGLNLTVANKVIMLDLAWNLATENQAIDRAHRIGQTKPVAVQRLVIRDTVEQRMLALQEKKQNLADGAMGEGGGKLGRLTVDDLTRLFFGESRPEA